MDMDVEGGTLERHVHRCVVVQRRRGQWSRVTVHLLFDHDVTRELEDTSYRASS